MSILSLPLRFLSKNVLSIGHLVFCLAAWCLLSGCGRDVVPFSVAVSGMARPTVSVNDQNIDGILDRVRWLEESRYWAQSLVQAHSLARMLGDDSKVPISPFCGISCGSCLGVQQGVIVDERIGEINMICWTGGTLNGTTAFEVPSISSTEGEGFEDWYNLCRAGNPSSPNVVPPICMRGSVGYRATRTRFDLEPIRMDLVWVVGLWVREGDTGQPEKRLDGVMGFVYEQRSGPPTTTRNAILLDEQSILYQNFQGNSGSFQVDLLAVNGNFRCTYSRRSDGDTCVSLDGNQTLNFVWPTPSP